MLLQTNAAAGLPTALVGRPTTAKERAVLSLPQVGLVFDPRERLDEYTSALYFDDVKGGRLLKATNGVMASQNGNPVVDFPGGAAGGLLVDYTLPASYTIVCGAFIDTVASVRGLNIDVAESGARAALWVNSNAALRLDHSSSVSGANISSATSLVTNGAHVFWGSYNADAAVAAVGAAAIGYDSLTPVQVGTINQAHKASSQRVLGGYLASSTYASDLKMGITIIIDGYCNVPARQAILSAAILRCAEHIGATLS